MSIRIIPQDELGSSEKRTADMIPPLLFPRLKNLYNRRAERLRELAENNPLGDYLRFAALIAHAQEVVLYDHPLEMDLTTRIKEASAQGKPPLDIHVLPRDKHWQKLLMALIAVAFIVTCWFQTDQKRYQIYMICGAKKRHIVFFLTVDMLLLSQIAYWGALACTQVINRGFSDFLMPLPLVWRVWIGIGVFAFCWLVVLLRSLPLLQHYRNVSGFEVK